MRQGRESLPRAVDCRREVGVSTGGLCDDRIVEQILPQPGSRYRPDRQRLPRVEIHSHVHNRAGYLMGARPGVFRCPHDRLLNSPPAPAPPSAPDHCRPPPANTRPPDQPRGTDLRPTGVTPRSCLPQ